MRPYVEGEDMSNITVSKKDTPIKGGMIAHDESNPVDQWYVAPDCFAEYECVMDNPVMKYFKFDHLPAGVLRDTSERFCVLADQIDEHLVNGPEKTVCLRKILEAKDCAVRAALDLK